MRKNNKKGFTLVELLVVIAILAILASVAVVGYTAFVDKANESATNTEAHQIDKAIESALLTSDGVKVGTDLWVVAGDAGYTVVTTLPEGDVEDLSADFAGMPGDLANSSGTLTYTNNGITVELK